MAMQAFPETVMRTEECDREAAILRSYCEAKFPIGEPTSTSKSVTGQNYRELCSLPSQTFISPKFARIAAESRFEGFSENKSGILYWRITPEIAWANRKHGFAYYMRLLISDKPRIS